MFFYGAINAAGSIVLNSESAVPVKNFITDLYYFLSVEIARPEIYGAFHLISLAITALLTVVLCVFFRNCKDKTMRIIVGAFWCAMLVLELLDQFVLGTTVSAEGILVFNYCWRSFPFQLCNTGLWVMPLIILMPDSKLRDGIMLYMGLFSLFGGFITMSYPYTIFVELLITDIHTMVHHGSQVAVGFFMLVYNRRKINFRTFRTASLVFITLVGIAVVLNEVGYNMLEAYGINTDFNMFYISPYFDSGLPVFTDFYAILPSWAFILTYIAILLFVAFLMYFVIVSLIYSVERSKERKSNAEKMGEADTAVAVSLK